MTTLKAAKTRLLKYALAKPDAALEHPWGENVAKVKGKVFVFFGLEASTDFVMGVKLSNALLYAKSLPYVEAMGYGLGPSGWVSVKTPRAALPVELFEEWIDESYHAVAKPHGKEPATAKPEPYYAVAKRATGRSRQASTRSPRGVRPEPARASARTSRSGDGRRGTRSSSR